MADDRIQVQITADAADFAAAMQSACSAAQASFAALKQSSAGASAGIDAAGKSGKTAGQQGKKATDDWANSFSNLGGAFNKSINGMILGTTTWQKSVQRLAQTALSDLLNFAEKGLVGWLTNETAKTAATEAGVAARTAAESAGQSTGLAQMAMSALKAISGSAAEAAANTYASVSSIPYVGWILAPAAAAAAFAAVLAFGGKVPSAAGGMWNVPADTLAMVHKQESILPAGIAQPMRNFFAGNGPAAGAGQAGDSYAITIQAIDTQSGAQFLMNNAGAIAQGLARELRNGNSSLRSAMK
ncbi:MAG TPA: hypothetical protein VGL83_16830 [Stellaceae bacterium]